MTENGGCYPFPGCMEESYVIFRYDDYGKVDGTQVSHRVDQNVLDIFANNEFPLTVAAIPDPLSSQPESIQLLRQFVDTAGGELALHGWDHKYNLRLFATDGVKSEFKGLSYEAQLKRILAGKEQLETWFNRPAHTMVPPWNSYDETTLRASHDAGIQVVSADVYGPSSPEAPVLLLPTTLSLAGVTRLINRWSSDPKSGRIAVISFHSYDLFESDSSRATTSLRELDLILARIKTLPGVVGADFRTVSLECKDILTPRRFVACQLAYRMAAEIWSSKWRKRVVNRLPFFRADLDSAGYETEQFYRTLVRRWRLLRCLP